MSRGHAVTLYTDEGNGFISKLVHILIVLDNDCVNTSNK